MGTITSPFTIILLSEKFTSFILIMLSGLFNIPAWKTNGLSLFIIGNIVFKFADESDGVVFTSVNTAHVHVQNSQVRQLG